MDAREQQQAAEQRYRDSGAAREETRQRQETAGTAVVDDREQLEARAARLLSAGGVGLEAVLGAVAAPGPPEEQRERALERILGAASELVPVNFLARGARAARAVGRIGVREDGRVVGSGTGFLVGARLLLTNNHVLPAPAVARASFVEFDAELDLDGLPRPVTVFELDPAVVFLTDEHLDFTLVAVRPGRDGRPAGDGFGTIPLIADQGKIVIGEPVTVVGHPRGRLKEVAVRENELLHQLPDFLQYGADTEPGSSGSPVFNGQWEVVALHHAGVPGPSGAPDDWVANEGTRVSVVLRHLAGLALPPAQRAVLAELGAAAVPAQVSVPVDAAAAAPSPAPTPREAARTGLTGRARDGRHLVLLHGRSQSGEDLPGVRAHWAGGLARGLAAAGLPPIDARDASFPFYGAALTGALGSAREVVLSDAAPGARPDAAPVRDAYTAVLEEAARATGMPASEPAEGSRESGALDLVQRALSWLAGRSALDEAVIATVFRDVAAYLTDERVRKVVLDVVLDELPPDGDLVLVAHSLGTVVAMDVLQNLPDRHVPLLVTAGSPLGLDAVHTELLAPVLRRPANVARWVNAWAVPDAVAIGCPLGDDWSGVLDVRTANPRSGAHDIAEYLADARVAGEIGAARGTAP